jgi:hypothetical protein
LAAFVVVVVCVGVVAVFVFVGATEDGVLEWLPPQAARLTASPAAAAASKVFVAVIGPTVAKHSATTATAT